MYFRKLIIKFINNVRAPKHACVYMHIYAVISPPAVQEVILVAACQRTHCKIMTKNTRIEGKNRLIPSPHEAHEE